MISTWQTGVPEAIEIVAVPPDVETVAVLEAGVTVHETMPVAPGITIVSPLVTAAVVSAYTL
jgi:hypothetical protein